MPAAGESPRTLRTRIHEAILLRGAESRAAALPEATTAELAQLAASAQSRFRAARALRDAGEHGAAATLYREVARHLIAAFLSFHKRGSDAPLEAFQNGVEAGDFAGFSPQDLEPGAQLRRALDLAAAADTLFIDALSTADARAALDAVDAALSRIGSAIEARTVQQIRRTRYGRILGLFFLVVMALGVIGYALLAPNNIARGQPVIADSYWPGSARADALVNGKNESPWASATARNGKAWFRIDLGSAQRIRGALVVNRKDDYANVNQGIVIEVSDDDRDFKEVARSDKSKGPGESWRFRSIDTTARYVRVRRLAGEGGFALSEIEIYGG